MDDFFKQFRENLENRPEPAFEERDWKDMDRRLDQLGDKKPAAPAWWWALPFLVLLLAANAFVLLEQRKATRKIQEIAMLRDTVYQTHVVYLTDTIYHTTVIREQTAVASAPGAPAVSFPLPGWKGFSFPAPGSAPGAGQPAAGLFLPGGAPSYSSLIVRQREREGQQLPGAEQTGNPQPDYWRGFLDPLPANSPSFVQSGQPAAPQEIPLEPVLAKRKKTLGQYVYPLRPKGLQIGVSGGGAFPFSQSLSRQAGGMGGLQLAIEFSPSIRMWMDASYFKIHIESNQMDESIGVPVIEPPSDDFAFKKAEVPQPTLQFSAGMQYLFLTRSKWSPFAGLGYGTASLLYHDVIYEFENPLTGEEWSFDGSVPGNMWQTGYILFQAGLEHEFSRQWSGQLAASYRTNWNTMGSLSPRILGIRGSLMYKF
ncbi:MAG: hypothetical protein H6557_09580 [Lewinellaceae bacterium]|nr:hypothetical protein [Phaeodactylibacter sp.]MCB9036856.1 hypothetical protein [Lewinellaceae bacterium]